MRAEEAKFDISQAQSGEAAFYRTCYRPALVMGELYRKQRIKHGGITGL